MMCRGGMKEGECSEKDLAELEKYDKVAGIESADQKAEKKVMEKFWTQLN